MSERMYLGSIHHPDKPCKTNSDEYDEHADCEKLNVWECMSCNGTGYIYYDRNMAQISKKEWDNLLELDPDDDSICYDMCDVCEGKGEIIDWNNEIKL